MNKYILVLFLAVSLGIKAQVQQNPVSTEFQVDYFSPKEYQVGPIRIDGADNFDHQTIKMVAGLKSVGWIIILVLKFKLLIFLKRKTE